MNKQTCTTFLLVGVGWLWKVVTVVSAGGVFGVPLAWWEGFTVVVVVVLTVLFAGSALVWGSLSIFPQNLDTRSWNKVDHNYMSKYQPWSQLSICKIHFPVHTFPREVHICQPQAGHLSRDSSFKHANFQPFSCICLQGLSCDLCEVSLKSTKLCLCTRKKGSTWLMWKLVERSTEFH